EAQKTPTCPFEALAAGRGDFAEEERLLRSLQRLVWRNGGDSRESAVAKLRYGEVLRHVRGEEDDPAERPRREIGQASVHACRDRVMARSALSAGLNGCRT